MQRVRSKICGLEFFLAEGGEALCLKDGLPVITRTDSMHIERNVKALGPEGVANVLLRRKKGVSVEQAVWDWIHFRSPKPKGLPPAARELFAWVDQNLRPAVENRCESMKNNIQAHHASIQGDRSGSQRKAG
jgi:hypothetical protein